MLHKKKDFNGPHCEWGGILCMEGHLKSEQALQNLKSEQALQNLKSEQALQNLKSEQALQNLKSEQALQNLKSNKKNQGSKKSISELDRSTLKATVWRRFKVDRVSIVDA